MDWFYTIRNEEKNDYGYEEFDQSIDTTILGYNTYKQTTVLNKKFPYEGKTNLVFTNKSIPNANKDVKFINEEITDYIKALKKEKGKNIWLVGGGKLIAKLFDNNLIDELQICIMPIVVGDGTPLFNLPVREQNLKLKNHKRYENGVVQLIYNID